MRNSNELDPNNYTKPLGYWGLCILLALALSNALPPANQQPNIQQAGLLSWIRNSPTAVTRIASLVMVVVFQQSWEHTDNQNGGCGPNGDGGQPQQP